MCISVNPKTPIYDQMGKLTDKLPRKAEECGPQSIGLCTKRVSSQMVCKCMRYMQKHPSVHQNAEFIDRLHPNVHTCDSKNTHLCTKRCEVGEFVGINTCILG